MRLRVRAPNLRVAIVLRTRARDLSNPRPCQESPVPRVDSNAQVECMGIASNPFGRRRLLANAGNDPTGSRLPWQGLMGGLCRHVHPRPRRPRLTVW